METFISLTNTLRKEGVLERPEILDAFVKIDRVHFVPKELKKFAYANEPLPIGKGQTISQPFTVAFMLNLLQAKKGDAVLDVGSGSGYTTALLSEIVGSNGSVIGVEIIPDLVTLGKKNIARYKFKQTEIHHAKDGIIGLPEKGPYDRILVSASASEIPEDLLNQIKKGGCIVAPIGEDIWKIEKQNDDSLKIEKHPGFAFVPLVEGR